MSERKAVKLLEASLARSRIEYEANQELLTALRREFAATDEQFINSSEATRKLSRTKQQLVRDIEHYERLTGKRPTSTAPRKIKAERDALGGKAGIANALAQARQELGKIAESYDPQIKKTNELKAYIQQTSSRINEIKHRQNVLIEQEKQASFKLSLIRTPRLVGLPWAYRADAEVAFKQNGDIHVYFAKAKGVPDSKHDGHAHYIVRRRKDGTYQRLYDRKPALIWPAILACAYDIFFWAERPSVTRAVVRG
jgi:hypothetical protein